MTEFCFLTFAEMSKTFWASPKQFGRVQYNFISIEGQVITEQYLHHYNSQFVFFQLTLLKVIYMVVFKSGL
jgi:hypothetical protein